MTDPSRPTTSSSPPDERLRDQAIAALVPLFDGGNVGDDITAHTVVEDLLDDYKAATGRELQLAAQIIALGWASLACVSASIAVKDQSLEDMLRLQGHAIALDRLSHKATRALEASRKERATNPDGMTRESKRWDEGAFRMAINQALTRMNDANAQRLAFLAPLKPPDETPILSSMVGEPMTPAVLARRRR